MQSGITASKELLSQFASLLSDPSHFALLATIESESLVPRTFLDSISPSFADNLSLLTPHLKDDEALYILLRRHTSAPALTAVTYVPDAAPVRQKMLFASTRLTMTRELGTEHFRETIFANAKDELSAEGFEKHDKHEQLEAPLTEEERTLGEVKRAEQEAGLGSGLKEIHLSGHMSMPISEDALEAVKAVGREESGCVILKIDPTTETIVLAPENPSSSSQPDSIPTVISLISTTEPRFTFFRYTHTHAGVESAPMLFFYTCPATANRSIKNRMMYPLMKRAMVDVASREAGVTVDKKFEVEEPSEIMEETVLDDLHPKAAVRTGFARPKRPGR